MEKLFLSYEPTHAQIQCINGVQKVAINAGRKSVLTVMSEDQNPHYLRMRNKLAAEAAMLLIEHTPKNRHNTKRVKLLFDEYFRKYRQATVLDAISRYKNPVTLLVDQFEKKGTNFLDNPLNFLNLDTSNVRRMINYYQPWDLTPTQKKELSICLGLLLGDIGIPAKELVCADFVRRLV